MAAEQASVIQKACQTPVGPRVRQSTQASTVKTMPSYMDVKIIDIDEQRCERLNSLLEDEDALVINGDGRDLSLLIEEGIKNTQAFVALTGNAETNILACLTAKRLGVRKTVAMVENIDYISMAESLDIGTIINKKSIAASHIYQMMLDANVHNVRFLMTANADVAEFIPCEGCWCPGPGCTWSGAGTPAAAPPGT